MYKLNFITSLIRSSFRQNFWAPGVLNSMLYIIYNINIISSLRSPCLHALKVRLIVILCCGVVYDCSHTAEINMHDVVMKGVTCYKDASEHDRYCNGNSGARVSKVEDS